MDLLDELLEGRQRHGHGYSRRHHDHHREEHYRDADRIHYEHARNHGMTTPVATLLGRLMQSKLMLSVLVVVVVVMLVSAFAILNYLLPLLPKLLNIAGETGLKGLLEQLAPFLNIVWNGTGKP